VHVHLPVAAAARRGPAEEGHVKGDQPWRLVVVAFKALRGLRPDYELWRDFPYEYEYERLAIDVINGGSGLREWVDDPEASPADLDDLTRPDEVAWCEEREAFLLYR
jgi:hypothetical protein